MIDCAVVGDSIAVGISRYFPRCELHAKVGIGSAAVLHRTKDATLVILSVGSNDPYNVKLLQNLIDIRNKITGKVIWILPVNQHARLMVTRVAQDNFDQVVSFRPGRDNIHPKSYRDLFRQIQSRLSAPAPAK